MAKKLYVGNLSYGTTDSDLRSMFEEFGSVESAQVIMDRESGRSKGFAFVEMGNQQEAEAAINGLNGKDVDGRALTVNEANHGKTAAGVGPVVAGRGGYGGGGVTRLPGSCRLSSSPYLDRVKTSALRAAEASCPASIAMRTIPTILSPSQTPGRHVRCHRSTGMSLACSIERRCYDRPLGLKCCLFVAAVELGIAVEPERQAVIVLRGKGDAVVPGFEEFQQPRCPRTELARERATAAVYAGLMEPLLTSK